MAERERGEGGERKRERERETETDRDRERQRATECRSNRPGAKCSQKYLACGRIITIVNPNGFLSQHHKQGDGEGERDSG